jgi:hypothetical protein
VANLVSIYQKALHAWKEDFDTPINEDMTPLHYMVYFYEEAVDEITNGFVQAGAYLDVGEYDTVGTLLELACEMEAAMGLIYAGATPTGGLLLRCVSSIKKKA